MMKPFRFLILALAVSQVTGCSGDTFSSSFYELIAIYNEMADSMIFVCDEDSADVFNKVKYTSLNSRWTAVTTRMSKFLEKAEEPEKKKIIQEFVDYLDQLLDAQNRITDQVKRLDQLRKKLAQEKYGHAKLVVDYDSEWPKITQVMKSPKNFKVKDAIPENPFENKANQGGMMPNMPGMPGGPGGMPGMPGPGGAPPPMPGVGGIPGKGP